jgi:hypothetical protein
MRVFPNFFFFGEILVEKKSCNANRKIKTAWPYVATSGRNLALNVELCLLSDTPSHWRLEVGCSKRGACAVMLHQTTPIFRVSMLTKLRMTPSAPVQAVVSTGTGCAVGLRSVCCLLPSVCTAAHWRCSGQVSDKVKDGSQHLGYTRSKLGMGSRSTGEEHRHTETPGWAWSMRHWCYTANMLHSIS